MPTDVSLLIDFDRFANQKLVDLACVATKLLYDRIAEDSVESVYFACQDLHCQILEHYENTDVRD